MRIQRSRWEAAGERSSPDVSSGRRRTSGECGVAAAALERANGVARRPPRGAKSVSVPLERAGEALERGLASHGRWRARFHRR